MIGNQLKVDDRAMKIYVRMMESWCGTIIIVLFRTCVLEIRVWGTDG